MHSVENKHQCSPLPMQGAAIQQPPQLSAELEDPAVHLLGCPQQGRISYLECSTDSLISAQGQLAV